MWLISCSVAFSDIFTIMGLGSPYGFFGQNKSRDPWIAACGFKLVSSRWPSVTHLRSKQLRSREPSKSVVRGKSEAWSKSCHKDLSRKEPLRPRQNGGLGHLLQRTGYARKRVIRIRSDQAHRSHDQHQNHGQHHRVFRDVLPRVFGPQPTHQFGHFLSSTPLVSSLRGRTEWELC
jgi:hypothetical protein